MSERFPAPYRGRFAPSPTGPLHLGSLITAVAGWLDARSVDGQWLMRMEDIDPPREQAGAAGRILASLEQHGLHHDEHVLWQNRRSNAYNGALAQLQHSGLLFSCSCSRREQGPGGDCRGNCRLRQTGISSPCALRVAVPPDFTSAWHDRWQGPQHWPLGRRITDFIVRRKDGLYAYQLAVVVDDAAQGITHVVRGSDLLESTPRQHLLQQLLGLPAPDYGHLPLITDSLGHKLSKQTHAPALVDVDATTNLRKALAFLQQPSPPTEVTEVDAVLTFATTHWAPEAVPHVMSIAAAP
ncbi:tRNA glutamyl-Q(34) synthetase GluQRS [Kineobactrum sediminis]|uniref:Glutamyl-Q tRNA(Asp) synthetase n=1 Tax=Kineobactrum sediminis TaxID=1905677 RepID=A0A2N5Y687_9GAMM|nr:tRNA glutamyl-Q(34) synthetase GluQRS [Kineobactrum sediminis]PLW83889.1 tRNA glutamyl-Q(34) synthetase GluQRS [Kineobactrum sediminis]